VAGIGNDERYFNGGRWPWVTYPIPAIWDDVLSVGAINNTRRKSSYSSWGTDVDVWAPGGGDATGAPFIEIAPSPTYYCYYYQNNHQCKYFGGEHNDFNGTSAATPIVAGVIALMKQVDPTLTPNEIESIIKSTARTDSPTPDLVTRIVDARRAVIVTRNQR
jgi:serine protease